MRWRLKNWLIFLLKKWVLSSYPNSSSFRVRLAKASSSRLGWEVAMFRQLCICCLFRMRQTPTVCHPLPLKKTYRDCSVQPPPVSNIISSAWDVAPSIKAIWNHRPLALRRVGWEWERHLDKTTGLIWDFFLMPQIPIKKLGSEWSQMWECVCVLENRGISEKGGHTWTMQTSLQRQADQMLESQGHWWLWPYRKEGENPEQVERASSSKPPFTRW